MKLQQWQRLNQNAEAEFNQLLAGGVIQRCPNKSCQVPIQKNGGVWRISLRGKTSSVVARLTPYGDIVTGPFLAHCAVYAYGLYPVQAVLQLEDRLAALLMVDHQAASNRKGRSSWC